MVGKDLMKEQVMTDVKDVFYVAAGVTPAEYVTGSFAVVFRGLPTFTMQEMGWRLRFKGLELKSLILNGSK